MNERGAIAKAIKWAIRIGAALILLLFGVGATAVVCGGP